MIEIVSPGFDTTAAYDTTAFTAIALDSTGDTLSNPVFVWSTSNTGLATVDSTGAVVTLHPGQLSVRATAGTVMGSASLTIGVPRATSVVLYGPNGSSQPTSLVPVRGTEDLVALVYDSKGGMVGGPGAIVWQSSDSSIVTVRTRSPLISNGGTVSGETAGTATISATFGGKTSNGLAITSYAMPPLTRLVAGASHTCGLAVDSTAAVGSTFRVRLPG